MRDLAESADENLDPASLACLKKTRSGVRLQAALCALELLMP